MWWQVRLARKRAGVGDGIIGPAGVGRVVGRLERLCVRQCGRMGGIGVVIGEKGGTGVGV